MTLDELSDLVLRRSIEAGPDAVRNLIEETANRRAEAATVALRAELAALREDVTRITTLREITGRRNAQLLRDLAEARALLARVRDQLVYERPSISMLRAILCRADVAEGLAQSARGEVHDLGSFAKYARDEARRCPGCEGRVVSSEFGGDMYADHLRDCPARDEGER